MAAEQDTSGSAWSVGFKELLSVAGLSIVLVGGWTTLNTQVSASVKGVDDAKARIVVLENRLEGMAKLDSRVSVAETKYTDIDRRLNNIESNIEKVVQLMLRTKR